MVERRRHARFAFEARAKIRALRQMPREHLDGDLATEPRVAGAIHLPHPARSKRRNDFIGSEAGRGGQWHISSLLQRDGTRIFRVVLGKLRTGRPSAFSRPRHGQRTIVRRLWPTILPSAIRLTK